MVDTKGNIVVYKSSTQMKINLYDTLMEMSFPIVLILS